MSQMLVSDRHSSPLFFGVHYLMFLFQVFMKLVLIFLIAAGVNPFNYLGMDTPSFWTWASENRFYACLMIFFLCNAVEGQLISTGAFEIKLNDFPIWSKLETGRIPQPPELFQMIDNHFNMIAQPPYKPNI